ncbi:MAG TPA: HDOD domain-containing protein [Burkholderiaceae bacterium]
MNTLSSRVPAGVPCGAAPLFILPSSGDVHGASCDAPLDLAKVRDLPALPAAVLELLRLLGDDEVDARALAAKIGLDPALTAKALRLANSPFYGVSRHITSVLDATVVLGLRAVRTVATAASLVGSFEAPSCPGFDFPGFWRHALYSAVSARLVASAVDADAEVAFTAGLLHDIGHLVLASGFPDRFSQVLALRAGHESELEQQDAERVLLGLDHAAVGACVTERWHFPKQIVEAIAHHHATRALGAVAELAHIVRVGGVLAHGLEVGHPPQVPLACAELWAGLGLTREDWPRIAAETESQAQAICAALLD